VQPAEGHPALQAIVRNLTREYDHSMRELAGEITDDRIQRT
jgi:hypothetical protein